MRRLSKGRLARILASFLIALFAGPTLLGLGMVVPASAQIATTMELEEVAMVPFLNLTKVQPEILSDKAASAVHQGLMDTGTYNVRDVEETKQKMADMGIRPPLDEMAFDRIGEAMGVNGIVFGEIRAASVRRLTRSSQGEVTLMVAIYDIPSRTVRTGVIVTGKSNAAIGEIDPDTLIDDALTQAAFQAKDAIESHRPITGQIQWASEKEASINIGTTKGVKDTMKFVVLRQGKRIGIIEITRVERSFSDARIVEGKARTSDWVREIVEVPVKSTTMPVPGVKKAKSNKTKNLLYALGALLLIYAIARNKGGDKNPTSGITATAVSNIIDTTISKVLFYEESATQLNWKGPDDGNSEFVAGYEIWRNNELYWFVPYTGFTDNTYTFPTPISSLDVVISANPLTGIPTVNWTMLGPYGADAVPPQVLALTGAETPVMTYSLRGDFYTNTVSQVTVYLGPYLGDRVTYQVRKIYTRPSGSGNARVFVVTQNAQISSAVPVTFIAAPELMFPVPSDLIVDPTAVEFSFYEVMGADNYVLQISQDSQFTQSVTTIDNLTTIDGVHAPGELIIFTKNLETLLGTSIPSGTRLFWRIGARYNGDKNYPLPYPKPSTSPPDSYRYVFSERRHFDIQ